MNCYIFSGCSKWRNNDRDPRDTGGPRGLERVQVPEVCHHLLPGQRNSSIFQETAQTSVTALANARRSAGNLFCPPHVYVIPVLKQEPKLF